MALVSNISLDTQLGTARFQALQTQVDQLQAKALGNKGPGAKTLTKAEKEKQLLKTTQEFESIFIYFLLERMRAASPKAGLLDSSREHEIFTSMQDQEISRQLAFSGGLGISRMLFDQMKKTL